MRSKYIYLIVSTVIFLFGLTMHHFDNSQTLHSVPCTVTAKQVYQGGYKSSGCNLMAFKGDDGSEFEERVSLNTYIKFNVGDHLVMKRRWIEINPDCHWIIFGVFGDVAMFFGLFCMVSSIIFLF